MTIVLPTGPWSTQEFAKIRLYLGYPALFHQFEPKLENAIKAVQSEADGGALPDDSTQQLMRWGLIHVESIEQRIRCYYPTLSIIEADQDKVKMDAVRAVAFLKQEGTRIIAAELASPLSTTPVRDFFYASADNVGDGAASFGSGHSSASRAFPFFGRRMA